MKEKQLYKFTITNRDDPETGFLIAQNIDWILIHHNPVDFVLDGFMIIKKKYLKNAIHEDHEKFMSSVIKSTKSILTPTIDLNNLYQSLMKYEVIQIEDDDETVCDLVKIINFNNDSIDVVNFGSDGCWEKESEIVELSDIHLISLETDYINSLLQYSKINE